MSVKLGGWKRWLIGLAIVGVIYTITGFFIIPAIARSQIEKRGSEALNRTVTLEKVRLNPFTFRVRLENLNITDTMAEKLASWSLVDVNFDPLTSLFKWQFYFKEMRLVDPKKWLHIDQEGKLNIADLVEAAESPDEQPEAVSNLQLPPIGVGLMHIEGWALDFTDDSQLSPFHSAIGPMTFDLTGFTTRPNEESPYSLEGTTEAGESFSWTGSVSAQPLGSKGKIQFSGLAIPKYAPYAEQFHNAVISTGTVACSTEYEVALGESLTMRFIDTQVAIENVQLRSKGADEPEVTLGKFAMHVNQADAMARTADVEQIEISGIKVAAERRADGTIDLLDWVKKDDDAPQPQPEASTPATEGEVAFQFPDIKVKTVSAGDATVRFTDQTTPEPAVMQVSLVSLKAENATSDLSKPVNIQLEMSINESATVKLSGTVQPQPLNVSLDVDCTDLALPPLQPYIEQFADVKLVSGSVQAKGRADASLSDTGEIQAAWAGDASVNNIQVNSLADENALVSLTALNLKGTSFLLEPLTVKAEEIQIVEPAGHVRMDEEGKINILTAMRVDQTKPEEPAEAAETEATQSMSEQLEEATHQRLPFNAEINTLAIESGKLTFEDESIPGGFTSRVEKFGGTIKGLSSENVARADVDLSAVINGTAPLKITGAVNPLAEDVYTDLKIDLSNLSLPPFSPYSGKYIAQKIDKGALSVDVSYKLSKRDVNGENKVVVDQFNLGEKVESKDSLGLPVGLAVALLRDREGKISLDVPVRGNLDDPQFKIGRVVMRVIGNIITKAATAPFSLLGNMLGGAAKEVDLSFVDFTPGTASLSEDGLQKIQLLDDALFERPTLRLEIQSPTYAELDREPMREAKLRKKLMEERSLSMPDAAPVAPGKDLPLDESITLIRSLYLRMYPEEAAVIKAAEAEEATQPAAESTPEPAAAPAPPPEEAKQQGFLSRMFKSVFGGKEETKAAAPEPEPEVVAVEEPAPVEAEQPAAPALPSATRMRNRIMETIVLTDRDFQQLSEERALAIQEAINASGRIEAERVSVPETATIPEDAKTTTSAAAARVYFGLN